MQAVSLPVHVKRLVAAAVLLGIAGGVTAVIAEKDKVNLRGSFYIAGKSIIDPPPNEPKRTHAYFHIEGAAALQMYRTMKAAESDECAPDDGWRVKRAGSLACLISPDGKEARCDFGIELANGRLTGGSVC
jgi:hypothetical protein